MSSRFRFVAIALVIGSGCPEPVDRVAKKRIFSPEDAPKVVSSAGERLAVDRLGGDARQAERIFGMSAAEATERIGPHKYTCTFTFEWEGKGEGVKLTENRTLVSGRGGVSGDFHATIENSRDQGLEVIRSGGEVYARNRYGKFRRRLRDRGMAERTREETFSAVKDVNELFRHQLKLQPKGTETVEGRKAWKYAISVGTDGSAPDGRTEKGRLPPVLEPKGGRDESTKRRLGFFEHRSGQSLSGQVWVDEETGVILRSQLSGGVAVSGGEKGGPMLKISLRSGVTPLAKEPFLRAPADALPDADKPEGIADALDRFGIPRAGKRDAGTGPEESAKKGVPVEEE